MLITDSNQRTKDKDKGELRTLFLLRLQLVASFLRILRDYPLFRLMVVVERLKVGV